MARCATKRAAVVPTAFVQGLTTAWQAPAERPPLKATAFVAQRPYRTENNQQRVVRCLSKRFGLFNQEAGPASADALVSGAACPLIWMTGVNQRNLKLDLLAAQRRRGW